MKNSRFWIIVVTALALVVGTPRGSVSDEMPATLRSRIDTASVSVATAPEAISVVLDFAKILTLEAPARTIAIGNSGIVDGTLSDERTVVLTGRAIGTTNIIVLREAGREVLNLPVHVVPASRQLTTVYQGSKQQTFSRVGPCKPVASVGDDRGYFDAAQKQTRERQEFATGRAGGQ
jgi:hypothetical protein